MRRVPIRTKLAAALSVPLLGLMAITVIEVIASGSEVEDVRAQTGLARASVGPSGVIAAIQDERIRAVTALIGREGAVRSPAVGDEETRRATDESIAKFRSAIESGTAAAAEAYAPALANLDDLDDLRADIDAVPEPRDVGRVDEADGIYRRYAALVRPFLDANSRVATSIDDAELRQAASLVDTTTRQVETSSDLTRTAVVEVTTGSGFVEPAAIAELARLRSTFDMLNRRLLEAAPPFDDVVGPTYPAALVERFTTELDKVRDGGAPDVDAMVGALDIPADQGYTAVSDALVTSLFERAGELNDAAEQRERTYVLMAVATLATALVLTWLVSRSITRPLRALTRQARDMADRRLPGAVADILDAPLGEDIAIPRVPPVRTRTRDEVSDVADALNTVQDTAIDLAVEQAVLRRNIADSFVNLGRRNQNLLGRQLDFITGMESDETDPDTLADLFRLDHLATRMRRNAESLLVLAGIEQPRKWAAPVRLTDVIRAALGEIEGYQRVTVRGMEPATVVGSAAADLAHLLAELIENALAFSPPDEAVEIRGLGRGGGYSLTVTDWGLGMPAGDIAAANRRLAGAESFTVAPSKYLGHYVAGNLARRHGIQVRLGTASGQGVTANVELPPALLTTAEGAAAPVTPPGGHRAVGQRAAGAADPVPSPAAAPGASDVARAPGAAPPRQAAGVAHPPGAAAAGATPPEAATPPAGEPRRRAPADDTIAAPDTRSWAPRPVAPDAAGTPRDPVPASSAVRPSPAIPPSVSRPPVPRVPSARTGSEGAPADRDDTVGSGIWPRQAHRAGPRVVGGPPAPRAAVGRRGAVPPRQGGVAPLGPLPREGSPLVPSDGRPTAPGPDRVPSPTRPGAPALVTSPAAAARGGAPGPQVRGSTPGETTAGLVRRVPGAQLPRATVISLHGHGDRRGGRPGTIDARPSPTGGTSSATDVRTLLSSFTAGVQRGLDDARRRAEGPLRGPDASG